MWNKIDAETKIGGITAIIAIIAIVFEMVLGGFTRISVVAGIKDIAATIVAILVLIVAVRKLRPKKIVETFESVLNEELSAWQQKVSPLVHRATDCNDKIRYYLITNFDRVIFADDNSIEEICEKGCVDSGTFNGKFVEMPFKMDKNISFFLNASTFKERAKAKNKSYEDTLDALAPAIANCISKSFQGFCKAEPKSSGKEIVVTFDILESPKDARKLVKVIDHVLTLYTIAA